MDSVQTSHRPSGGGMLLRLFASIPVPADIAQMLADHGDVLASRAPGAIALAPEDLVLPIAFFGDVAEEYVPVIAKAMEAAAGRVHGATSCDISGSVLLDGGSERGVRVDLDLFALLGSMRDELLAIVAPYAPRRDMRAWTPRIALVRSEDGGPLPDLVQDMMLQPQAGSWIAPEITLMASIVGPMGRHFRPMHVAQLGMLHSPTQP